MGDKPVSAQAMAQAARVDPQFRVPARPRLRRGIAVRSDGDQLVVDGTPTRHVLRGKSATTLVPRLLPLCDGIRDHAEIAAGLDGVTEETVFAAVSLLWTTGLVEDAAPAGVDVGWVPDHLADLLSRLGDATEANASWEHAAARLAAARVAVHGDPAFAAAIATALHGTLPVTVDDGDKPAPGTTLVIAAGEPRPELADACWHAGVPLLRVALDGPEVEIGPYADQALGPCLDCLRAESPDASGAPTDPDLVTLAAGLVASDVTALVSRAAKVGLPLRWRRVHLSRLGQAVRTGTVRPGCPRCATVPAPAGTAPGVVPLSARYEAAVAFPPLEYADVKGHQAHYQPANVALQRGHKTWPVAPATALPEPEWARLSGRPAAIRPGVTVADLSVLLAVTAGWQRDTPERVYRWSATGGNIGSVVAHLVVRDVDGLAPGTYGYAPARHALSLLRGGPPPPCRDGCGAPACLLLTADLQRVASKYAAFGLRVVMLDAGCAHAAAHETARWLGIPAATGVDLADAATAELLGTDPDAEPVTGLIHLGART